MTFSNRICQTLYEEHAATVALMARIAHLLGRYPRGKPPDANDRAVARLLTEISSAIEADINRHFAFEEDRLFPYLDAAGSSAIGAHLTEEHAVMRPLGLRLAALAHAASAAGFDAASWDEFRKNGQDLCDRLVPHAQKEDMALLPLLEDTMDAETEAELYGEYVGNE
ncbi:MAG: hemerythrin domain-containing protein [Xanthobacteraceae bacterium]